MSSTVHWHAHAVGALCFSADGRFLLSGGQEAVLVRPCLPAQRGGDTLGLAQCGAPQELSGAPVPDATGCDSLAGCRALRY